MSRSSLSWQSKKIIRWFFWAGTEKASGGKCKVNWMAVCRPTSVGGLGILNMEKFGRPLHLRWSWLDWTAPERPWIGFENPCNEDDMEFFYAMTKVTIGNRIKASFWLLLGEMDFPKIHRTFHLLYLQE
jgi:hypothetical protein